MDAISFGTGMLFGIMIGMSGAFVLYCLHKLKEDADARHEVAKNPYSVEIFDKAKKEHERLHPHASIVETIPADPETEKPAVNLDHSQAVQDMSREHGDTGSGY